MKKFYQTITATIVALVFCNIGLITQPITPNAGPCPCSSLYPGYYFTGKYHPFKPVLYSYMPYDVMIDYIIMDSIVTYAGASYPTLV